MSTLLDHGEEAEARRVAAEIRHLDRNVKGNALVHTFSYDESTRERFRKNLETLGLV